MDYRLAVLLGMVPRGAHWNIQQPVLSKEEVGQDTGQDKDQADRLLGLQADRLLGLQVDKLAGLLVDRTELALDMRQLIEA